MKIVQSSRKTLVSSEPHFNQGTLMAPTLLIRRKQTTVHEFSQPVCHFLLDIVIQEAWPGEAPKHKADGL